MMRVSALALLMRRGRSEVVAVGLLAVLVAFTAFVSVAAIRLFERAADDGLRRDVAAANVVQRTIRASTTRSLLGQETGPTVAGWQAEGAQLRTSFSEPIRDVVEEGNLAIGSVRLRVTNPPEYPIFITLRYQDAFPELVELASGRWPVSTNEQLPPVAEIRTTPGGIDWPMGIDHSSDAPRRFELALQEATAQQLGLGIGSVLDVGVDLIDPMLTSSIIGRADVILAPTELEITGLYRVRDPESDGWFGSPELRIDDLGHTRADIADPIAFITGYVPPDAVPGLVSSGLPFEYRWRYPILIDRLDADAVEQTKRGLVVLESLSAGTSTRDAVIVEAGLLPILERHDAVRNASQAVLALAASAPLALAAGAIAMAAVLLARRRRADVIVARGRGASGRVLLAASLIEAVMVATVACLAGLGLAIVLVPGAELEPSLGAAFSIGATAVVVLTGAAWPQIRQPLGNLERGARPARRTDPRRLVAELSVVALAAIGAYVLRQRGIAGTSAGFDPFLAAVPPLIALAAGIVAVRLYPPAMAVAGWLAGRRRDLVPVLGVRTIARGAASSLSVLVLLLAVAFAAFASVVSSSVDQAQRAASWIAVGADVRLEPARSQSQLPSGLDPAAIPGVEAAAVGYIEQGVRAPSGTGVGTITLQAVDAGAYASVVGDSPIEPGWPRAFLDQPVDGPVPAIVGPRLTGGDLGLRQGDTFQISVLGRTVQMQVAEVRSAVAGIATGDSFVIVPYSWLEHAVDRDVPVSVMWLRLPAQAVGALTDATGADAGDIEAVSRYDAYAALRDEPLLGAVGAGFALAFAVSVAFAVLTLLGAVILSVGRRARDLAVLRTLGLGSRQQARLTMVEHAPPILVALLPGLALGIGVAIAVAPGLDLGALSGSSGNIPLAIDWVALAALSVALAVLALVAVVIGSWLARRATILNALRIANE